MVTNQLILATMPYGYVEYIETYRLVQHKVHTFQLIYNQQSTRQLNDRVNFCSPTKDFIDYTWELKTVVIN